jgi:hypothetical protein
MGKVRKAFEAAAILAPDKMYSCPNAAAPAETERKNGLTSIVLAATSTEKYPC